MAAVPGILRQWNPGIVPNLQLWIDTSDKSTLGFTDASRINTISDKSGNGVILTQGVLANQPILSSNINGRQSVTFPINTYMSTTTTALTSKFNNNGGPNIQESQYLIFKLPSLNLQNIITYMGNESSSAFQQYEYDVAFQAGTPSNIALRVKDIAIPTSYYLNTPNVKCNVFLLQTYFGNPRQFSFNAFINSNPPVTRTTNIPGGGGTINNYNTFYIGKSFFAPTSSQSFNGDMGEILMFTSNYSSNPRYNLQLEGYLAWKWGTTALLVNTHPYRNRHPT
jgi:hypothetical protein